MVQLDLLQCMWQRVVDRAFKRVNLEKQLIEIQSQLTQHQSQLLFFFPLVICSTVSMLRVQNRAQERTGIKQKIRLPVAIEM